MNTNANPARTNSRRGPVMKKGLRLFARNAKVKQNVYSHRQPPGLAVAVITELKTTPMAAAALLIEVMAEVKS